MFAAMRTALVGSRAVPEAAPVLPVSLMHAAHAVLSTGDCLEKARITKLSYKAFCAGEIPLKPTFPTEIPTCPDSPTRPSDMVVLSHNDIGKTVKRGAGAGVKKRVALLHALAHIESVAIDLAWDDVLRFGPHMPDAFSEDLARVAFEEGTHFAMIASRLRSLGSHYGELPVHESLWDSADRTKHTLCGRLVTMHTVHEARGLDVVPKMIQKLYGSQDKLSAGVLSRIYVDEVGHVAVGVNWLRALVSNPGIWTGNPNLLGLRQCGLPEAYDDKDRHPGTKLLWQFHQDTKEFFTGNLKGPFNHEGRLHTGMVPEWYEPLVSAEALEAYRAQAREYEAYAVDPDSLPPPEKTVPDYDEVSRGDRDRILMDSVKVPYRKDKNFDVDSLWDDDEIVDEILRGEFIL